MNKKLIIVNNKDEAIGTGTKEKCHTGEGILHKAIAIFIFNYKNQLLLTKRSKFKNLWPGFWDASCCTHIYLNETPERTGERRLLQELRIRYKPKFLFKFQYKAKYKNIGSENEICSVLVGKCNEKIKPNPREIEDYKWISLDKLGRDIPRNPNQYTPWLKIALRQFLKFHKSEGI